MNDTEPTYSDVEFMDAYRKLTNRIAMLKTELINEIVANDALKRAINALENDLADMRLASKVASELTYNPHLKSVELSQDTKTYKTYKTKVDDSVDAATAFRHGWLDGCHHTGGGEWFEFEEWERDEINKSIDESFRSWKAKQNEK